MQAEYERKLKKEHKLKEEIMNDMVSKSGQRNESLGSTGR